MARPKETYKFEAVQIEDAWQAYKAKADKHTVSEVSAGKVVKVTKPQVYTLEAFQVFIGMDGDTWERYGKIPRFSGTISRIRAEVFAQKKTALLNGYGSTQGLMFDMRANYGINDKQIVESTIQATVTTVTPQVIAAPVPIARDEREVDV